MSRDSANGSLAIDRQYNPKSPMILRRLVLHDFGDQNSVSESTLCTDTCRKPAKLPTIPDKETKFLCDQKVCRFSDA